MFATYCLQLLLKIVWELSFTKIFFSFAKKRIATKIFEEENKKSFIQLIIKIDNSNGKFHGFFEAFSSAEILGSLRFFGD